MSTSSPTNPPSSSSSASSPPPASSSSWAEYPADYRAAEVEALLRATRAGESASLLGLSGAGKSNVIGFIANRAGPAQSGHAFALIDCNRLSEASNAAFFRLARRAVDAASADAAGAPSQGLDDAEALEVSIDRKLAQCERLTLLIDRFDDLIAGPSGPSGKSGPSRPENRALFNNLRALRDAHKFRLTYITATRHALSDYTELAELFYANTLWLRPLARGDARWTVVRYAARKGLSWDLALADQLIAATQGYPSLLRAACEAAAAGEPAQVEALARHPAVQARVKEFWSDAPAPAEIEASGLADNQLLMAGQPKAAAKFDTNALTAKELLLLKYLQAHPNAVCEKDDLIRAVWPEDKAFARGIRDDSLAQVVRRLREKIEADPSAPAHVITVPGRGYKFAP